MRSILTIFFSMSLVYIANFMTQDVGCINIRALFGIDDIPIIIAIFIFIQVTSKKIKIFHQNKLKIR